MSDLISMEQFLDDSAEPAVSGFLHVPANASADALILTHGAGANCQSKLLTALAHSFAEAGFTVLRCDLPFRHSRPHGPPSPALAARDRDGLKRAVHLMRQRVTGKVFLGGHSYGGRQATMLAAEEPRLADGLLLLSYPLHPPRKPAELRTAHFPRLATPSLFVHGSRDPFGSLDEMQTALGLIPAATTLFAVDRAGHELLPKTESNELPREIVAAFHSFFSTK
ncbi:MAG TPA: alpha/beta fold hydrolase [Candidatus Angelobacter sp.]|nr:alpha/beta fold hydrolase [Candidatus Angelobacter sp.]